MSRLVVVSNRGLEIERTSAGNRVRPAAGGVAQAIHDALLQRGGEWISVRGGDLKDPQTPYATIVAREDRIVHRALTFNRQVYGGHYAHCNEIFWPANHDDPGKVTYDPVKHACHDFVIRRLAEEIGNVTKPDDLILLEDYQLGQLPVLLREMGLNNHFSYFHHTPVASQDTLDRVPVYTARLQADNMRALLTCDLIGFHTSDVVDKFLTTAFGKHRHTIPCPGEYVEVPGLSGRTVKVMNNPIGVDAPELLRRVQENEISTELRQFLEPRLVSPVLIYSGGERRDPAKGRLNTIKALRRAFEVDPNLIGNIQFVCVSIPTRMEVPAYERYSQDLMGEIADLNEEFRSDKWEPVIIIDEAQSHTDCVLMSSMKGMRHPETDQPFRVATLISSFADGMNLTALEAVCGRWNDAPMALAMSENIGAASLLGHHNFTFDPYSVKAQADTIRELYRALQSPDGVNELHQRHAESLKIVKTHTVSNWLDNRIEPLVSEDIEVTPGTENCAATLAGPSMVPS
ncbi:MAG: hypothetical protein EOM26_07060 [Alphaproteobacteria bacterium]|nr:hypothetical protein [Alphaproteobacteria bacterium]